MDLDLFVNITEGKRDPVQSSQYTILCFGRLEFGEGSSDQSEVRLECIESRGGKNEWSVGLCTKEGLS